MSISVYSSIEDFLTAYVQIRQRLKAPLDLAGIDDLELKPVVQSWVAYHDEPGHSVPFRRALSAMEDDIVDFASLADVISIPLAADENIDISERIGLIATIELFEDHLQSLRTSPYTIHGLIADMRNTALLASDALLDGPEEKLDITACIEPNPIYEAQRQTMRYPSDMALLQEQHGNAREKLVVEAERLRCVIAERPVPTPVNFMMRQFSSQRTDMPVLTG